MKLAACVLISAALLLQGQASREARDSAGDLNGIVVAGDSTRPLRAAIITVSRTDGQFAEAVSSDDEGRFTVRGLPAGRYFVAASKPGFLTASVGAHKPGRPGAPVTIQAGSRTQITVRLQKGAVISGRIRDEDGLPTAGYQVHVLRNEWRNGSRVLRALPGSVESDDRGEYRLHGLLAGEYYVAAVPGVIVASTGRLRVLATSDLDRIENDLRAGVQPNLRPSYTDLSLATVFYPSTTSIATAQLLKVGFGEERAGVDLSAFSVPVATIRGTVLSEQGASPAIDAQIRMVPASAAPIPQGIGANSSVAGFASARSDGNGRFVISGVAPGQYILTAQQGAASAVRSWGMTNVSLGPNDLEAVIILQPTLEVGGHVTFDKAKPPKALGNARVELIAADPMTGNESTASSRVGPDGRFKISGLLPGKYRVTVGHLETGWMVESATAGSTEVLDTGLILAQGAVDQLQIALSDRETEVSGELRAPEGSAPSEYYVVIFPVDRKRWTWRSRYVRAGRPGLDGHFAFRGLPAGTYLIASVSDVEPDEWFDPSFLELIASTPVKISLDKGEKKRQDLQVVK